jgi:glyoxylase-like metal-dependent hydrolase (beta-lactamase superfamily II)
VVRHLNCGSMCPRGGALLGGSGPPWAVTKLVCHCLLVEAGDELVLVDTGFGVTDTRSPKRLGQPFRALVAPECREEETAVRQIERLGLDPADVRHIAVTHLDLDHAGGLEDFPNADVHVFAPELAAARNPPWREKTRYIPGQWAHGPKWATYEVDGDSWFGFDSVRLLPDLPVEIVLVPVVGHSIGHSAIAVKDGDGWLMHCGDAYFHQTEVQTPHSCPAGLRLFQNLVGHDAKVRKANQERLRELNRAHGDEVRLICSHDPADLPGSPP